MKVKKYVCDCYYCIYPFGAGAPVCIYDRMTQVDNSLPLRQCTEKGCNKYRPDVSVQRSDANEKQG